MKQSPENTPSPVRVGLAFATVYLVWGSTYFFIQVAVRDFPPMILGASRFLTAGSLLLGWCFIRGEKMLTRSQLITAVLTGLMLLLVANGAVITAEQWLPSSLVAVLVSTVPFWLVVLDAGRWKSNLRNLPVLLGLLFGFVGVILMFGEKVLAAVTKASFGHEMVGLLILMIGTMSWAGGSLYSKYRSSGSALMNSAWQMLAAGIAFLAGSVALSEWGSFRWTSIPVSSWLSVSYLILFGSVLAFSAYVWLLRVRPPSQVSTYAYVNPVVAVLLGVFLAGEPMSLIQLCGLVVILGSVMLVNMAKNKA
ncbi:MAG TPA: EamA family transporter [Bacteroidales bacterium]|nr:EamA family transporter [Bacteroidales bacterium]